MKKDQEELPASNCHGCKYLKVNILGERYPELDRLMEARLVSCTNDEAKGSPKLEGNVCGFYEIQETVANIDLVFKLLEPYLEEGEEFITYAADGNTPFGLELIENNAWYLTDKYITDFFLNLNHSSKYESIRIFSPAFDPNGEIIPDFLSVVGVPKKNA